jgi:hypothetical protein
MRLALRAQTRPVVKEDTRGDPNTRFRPHSVSKRAREIVRQALDKLRASRAVIVSPSAYRRSRRESNIALLGWKDASGQAPRIPVHRLRAGWRAALPERDYSHTPASRLAAAFLVPRRPQRKAMNIKQAHTQPARTPSQPPKAMRTHIRTVEVLCLLRGEASRPVPCLLCAYLSSCMRLRIYDALIRLNTQPKNLFPVLNLILDRIIHNVDR